MDSRAWGRSLTVKLGGKTNLWVIGLYAACPSSSLADEGFYNPQRTQMIDTHRYSKEHFPITDGVYDPAKLMRNDISNILQAANKCRAEVLIYGDFNERWYQECNGSQVKGEWRCWAEDNSLISILQTDDKNDIELTPGARDWRS